MFTNAVMESSISTAAQSEEGPDVSGDGTTMFFIRDGTSLRDINVATRPSGQPWSGGAPVAELHPGGNTANPSVSRDGLMIVFERLDEVQYSLWQSTRMNLTASWTSPQPLTSLPINAGFKPHSPTLSTDKLTIYFHGLGPSGKNDIFEAHRSSPTAAFDAPTPVPGINTAAEQEEGSVDLRRRHDDGVCPQPGQRHADHDGAAAVALRCGRACAQSRRTSERRRTRR